MLRDEPGARLHDPRRRGLVGLDHHARAHRVAVALRAESGAPRAPRGRRRSRCGTAGAAATSAAPSGPGPGRRPRRSRSTANDRPSWSTSRPARARDLVEAAAAVVAQQHVALVLACAPSLTSSRLVARHPSSYGVPGLRTSGDCATTWRQKKLSTSTACSSSVAREHAVHDVEVLPAVAVEVEGVRRPGPAAELGPRGRASRPRTCRRRGSGRASCRGRAGDRSPGSPAAPRA